jgi:ATP adenylyltransferase
VSPRPAKRGATARRSTTARGAAPRTRARARRDGGETRDWSGTLWSSWRMAYIERADEIGCIFCAKQKEADGEANLILHRGASAFVILNAFPYNPGHLMVSPYRHVGEFEGLTPDERLEVMDLIAMSCAVIERVMRPQGANVGANLGRVAGAGIVGHLHMHVVPRWNGDTNFMPVIGDTKVIPEGVSATYAKLRAAFRARAAGG